MLTRLRIRITLLAALLTGAVLATALGIACGIARQQYQAGRSNAFGQAVAQLQYQWDQFDQLEDSWLQRLEAETGMLVQLEENGRPLLYSQRRAPALRALLQTARSQAAKRYSVNLDTRPLTGLDTRDTTYQLTTADGSVYRCALGIQLSENGHWTALIALQNLAPEQTAMTLITLRFVLLGTAGWLVLCLICWFVAGRAIHPVGMAMDQQQAFLSAAGHELRTPLAVIRANAAAALCRPAVADKYLHVIDAETGRMGTLVDELLLLSAGASARGRLKLQRVVPDTLLLDFAESMEPLAAEAGRKIQVDLPEQAVPAFCCDAYRLRQILTILLDNALRFAPATSTIRLALQSKNGQIQFRVQDSGPGVAPADRRRIFQRFYTGDSSADRRRHYGLGLAVAQELVRLHHGRIWVEETPGGGATFCVQLPGIPPS